MSVGKGFTFRVIPLGTWRWGIPTGFNSNFALRSMDGLFGKWMSNSRDLVSSIIGGNFGLGVYQYSGRGVTFSRKSKESGMSGTPIECWDQPQVC